MMKVWNVPSLEEMDLSATAYAPDGGTRQDGVYKSKDGIFTIPSYGGSSGDSGTPGLAGNDPSISQAKNGQSSFVQVNP